LKASILSQFVYGDIAISLKMFYSFIPSPTMTHVIVLITSSHAGKKVISLHGTSAEQTFENMLLREHIASHQDVEVYFHIYTLEDGARVRLDKNIASNHMKACINEVKKLGKSKSKFN